MPKYYKKYLNYSILSILFKIGASLVQSRFNFHFTIFVFRSIYETSNSDK